MDERNVLVTGIGGNVGQGIARNIRNITYPVKITGTNVISFSAGNHLCDYVYLVPYASEPGYIKNMLTICNERNIHLIIPSTDYEAYFLAKHRTEFNCEIAVSTEEATHVFLDKYSTWQHFKKYDIPFANSAEPGAYKGEFTNIIVKPKKGRGSRGIHINPGDWSKFDNDFMVQEYHKGEEITTAFYVTKTGKLHGVITLARVLENGTTSECRVAEEYNEIVLPVVEKIIKHTEVRGSINLQSIITEDGRLIPFEVNCRISGTNSIRACFGFKDVLYTLQEYLYQQKPEKPVITKGVAVRVLMDVIYPDLMDMQKPPDSATNHFIF